MGFFGLGAFGLMCYHMSLMISNQTTIEQLKNGNPVSLHAAAPRETGGTGCRLTLCALVRLCDSV